MAFKNRNFSEPVYAEGTESPTRAVIISCEGCNTETDYFATVKDKLKGIISTLIEIEIVPRTPGPSEPKDVLKSLEKFIEKYDIKEGYDSLWLVCDREKVPQRKTGLQTVISHSSTYRVVVSNPAFELWLLMHVTDLENYKEVDLFENAKVSNRRRYIEKELSNILDNGFNKKKGRFNKDIVSHENIVRAMSQAQKYSDDTNILLDKLGTNVSLVVKDILETE